VTDPIEDSRAPRAVVTGASSGLGLETARALAERGYHLVLVCRDPGRGAAALASIHASAPRAQVELEIADFASQRAVRSLAERLVVRHPAVHLLVNNAGLVARSREMTDDGLERQFAVNHLAPFLLTNLLEPALMAGAPARVVVVASAVESMGRIDFDDLGRAIRYDPVEAYAQSKLANVLFARECARRWAGRGITVNAVHPGVVATKLLLDYSGRPASFGLVQRLRYPSPRTAAAAVVHLAVSADLSHTTGAFFLDGRPVAGSAASNDPDLAKRLWEVSDALTAPSAMARTAVRG
jgi:NAD(P)-dependent dehydrogenase (short-subunit alcohol dehydrogenase family)